MGSAVTAHAVAQSFDTRRIGAVGDRPEPRGEVVDIANARRMVAGENNVGGRTNF